MEIAERESRSGQKIQPVPKGQFDPEQRNCGQIISPSVLICVTSGFYQFIDEICPIGVFMNSNFVSWVNITIGNVKSTEQQAINYNQRDLRLKIRTGREMQRYEENRSQINGVLIKNSDMSFEMKNFVTGLVKTATENSKSTLQQASEFITESLDKKYPGGWICAIGRNFTVNITHEPGFFARISTENQHFVIYKIKLSDKSTVKLNR